MNIKICASLIGCLMFVFTDFASAENPRFEGEVVMKWLQHDGDDRLMQLEKEFTFLDRRGKSWQVPKGAVVDGASIPSFFWQTIGPPFVGDYRFASVVHDYFCDERTETWQDTHRMFYEASVLGGVGKKKAKMMYVAVYARGPRWETVETQGLEGPEQFTFDIGTPLISDDHLVLLQSDAIDNDLSLEQIEARLDGN